MTAFAFWRICLASHSCFKFILDFYFLRSRKPQLLKIFSIQSFSKHIFPLYFFFTEVPGVSFSLIWTIFLSIFQMYFLINYIKPSIWEDLGFVVWCVCICVYMCACMCVCVCMYLCTRMHASVPLLMKTFKKCLEETCFLCFDFFRCHVILIDGNTHIFGRQVTKAKH